MMIRAREVLEQPIDCPQMRVVRDVGERCQVPCLMVVHCVARLRGG